jgi:Nucleotide modification associated domain 3
MRAILVRIGIDQAYGGWNAPVDPATNEFVYVPIPEGAKTPQHPGLTTTYATVERALGVFGASRPGIPDASLTLPATLAGAATHLDPDFDHLTYGDNGERRGRAITSFQAGDLIVFYAGMRPAVPCAQRLIYAVVGLYHVLSVARVSDFPPHRWHENAHLRRLRGRPTDVVVHAEPGRSGRLRKCIPVGEFRGGAYRVRRDLLDAWGGLSCRDGFIQRSAVPPRFLEPKRFLRWFDALDPELVAANA